MVAMNHHWKVTLLAACMGGIASCAGPLGASVLPTMEAIPNEPLQRGEYLRTTQARPGREGRKGMSRTMRTLETTAALVATFVGSAASTSKNAVPTVVAPFEENKLFGSTHRHRKSGQRNTEDATADGSESAQLHHTYPPIHAASNATEKTAPPPFLARLPAPQDQLLPCGCHVSRKSPE